MSKRKVEQGSGLKWDVRKEKTRQGIKPWQKRKKKIEEDIWKGTKMREKAWVNKKWREGGRWSNQHSLWQDSEGHKKKESPCTAEKMWNKQLGEKKKKKSPARPALRRVTGERSCCPNEGQSQALGNDRLNPRRTKDEARRQMIPLQ